MKVFNKRLMVQKQYGRGIGSWFKNLFSGERIRQSVQSRVNQVKDFLKPIAQNTLTDIKRIGEKAVDRALDAAKAQLEETAWNTAADLANAKNVQDAVNIVKSNLRSGLNEARIIGTAQGVDTLSDLKGVAQKTVEQLSKLTLNNPEITKEAKESQDGGSFARQAVQGRGQAGGSFSVGATQGRGVPSAYRVLRGGGVAYM